MLSTMRWILAASITLALTLAFTAAYGEDKPAAPAGRRVLAADYISKRLGLVDDKGTLLWEYPIRDIHDLWVLKNGNYLLQTSWTKIIELTPEKKIVWEYDAAKMNGNAGKRVEVHGFQRLENGWTMIAESGTSRIIEVDAAGVIQKQIQLKVAKPDAHRDTRLVRKLDSGNYLVAHEGEKAVREYDPQGKVVWEYNVGQQVYSAQRLASGNTLIGTGSGHSVIEVDPAGKIVWSVQEKDLPGVKLAWVTMVDRLPNGNTMIVNCHAGPDNPQIVEVTPEKKVVWSFKNFTHFNNALPAARVLDAAN